MTTASDYFDQTSDLRGQYVHESGLPALIMGAGPNGEAVVGHVITDVHPADSEVDVAIPLDQEKVPAIQTVPAKTVAALPDELLT